MYAVFTRSTDTLTCRPPTTVVSVLFVRAMILCGLQGAACCILPQECGRGCVACCWSWSQLVHVAAELLYEGGCLDLRGGWCKELTGKRRGSLLSSSAADDCKSSL